jgi:uncharacterized protein YjbJ (UPF0337 family)
MRVLGVGSGAGAVAFLAAELVGDSGRHCRTCWRFDGTIAYRDCFLEVYLKQEAPMGSTTDKAKGMANKAVGNVKEGVGEAVGSDKLQAEGMAQKTKGQGQKAMGDAKSTVKDAANKVADAANRKL